MEDKRAIEGEEILGIFPGWIGRMTCIFAFTTQRLIVAKEKRLGGLLIPGESFGKPYYNCSRASTRRSLQMKEVSAEDILKANSGNFDIDYSDIAVVEMKSHLLEGSQDLLVFTAGDLSVPKYKLRIALKIQYLNELKDFLSMVLQDKFDGSS